MKAGIHPTYFPTAKISCVCGNTVTVGSTQEEISVELCSACHPFYTGSQKIVDTARRVERFKTLTSQKSDEVKNRATKRAERSKKRKPKFEMETTKSARIKKSA